MTSGGPGDERASRVPGGSAIPPDDPLRRTLHDEVHARPPARLAAPERIAHLSLRTTADERAALARSIAALAAARGLVAPDVSSGFAWLDAGDFRLQWEQHTEFAGLTFFRRVDGRDPRAGALDVVPREWLSALPGTTMVALRLSIDAASPDAAGPAIASFGDTTVAGSRLGEGVATALTDFRLDAEGWSRIVVLDHGMSERQAGRFVQRLIEIEIYRMMALLAFPLARRVGPGLADAEARLAGIAERTIREAGDNDAALLDDLTRLAAEVESAQAASRYRFSAARAYHGLVRRRIADLRELRIPGVQTIEEFMERRLAPAMATCESTAGRQAELAERIARASQLLRTRVDVALERQNQALLDSMNRRARLQLRLQQTVEGLSIAAITYYAAGLVGYLAKGAKASGVAIDAELATAVSIPLVAVAVWTALSRVRRRLAHD